MLSRRAQAIIVEDSPEAAALLESLLSNNKLVEITGRASNVDDGIKQFLDTKHERVFLDESGKQFEFCMLVMKIKELE
jgi:hypothetical protein